MIQRLLSYILPMILLLLLSSNTGAATNDSGIKIAWGYKGNTAPERWAQLAAQFAVCATGKQQSPINIIKKVTKTYHVLSIKYHSAPIQIMDDGVTELTLGRVQTIINDGHSIQLNFPSEAKESIIFAGQSYQLVQFHFHSPSENVWQGQAFPLEIHFVHQGEAGKLAVLGVFVKAGNENLALQKIIDHLPMDTGIEHTIPGQKIDLNDLLPIKNDYFNFPGSLTTPPCSEGVQWIVMATPIYASPAQIQQLRKAIGGNNARPIQPLNRRKIDYAKEKNNEVN